ncbi:MAG: hypothetical protein ACO1NX_03475 [Chitinophagaceae bacterium]
MKNGKWFGCICLLVWSLSANAQQEVQKEKETFSFSSINSIGAIFGDAERELALQTVNGVSYKSWFAGIGLGIDYYYFRSIPLFVDVRKMLRPGKWPVFAYGDVGLSIPWIKDEIKEGLWYTPGYKTGLYYDVGAGLEFPVKKNAVHISGGFSTKKMRELQRYPYIWGDPGRPDRIDRVNYKFSRLVIKAGFTF